MTTDKNGNVKMKVRGGSSNTKATESKVQKANYQGYMKDNTPIPTINTIIDNNSKLSISQASSEINKDTELSLVSKGIEGYHQQHGINHNVFMDPKDSGINPLVPASAGLSIETARPFLPVGGLKGSGVIGAALSFIPAAVDEYYSNDMEKSAGRTAVINIK